MRAKPGHFCLQEYREEGVTVLRGVLPASQVQLLQRAVRDLMVNQTLHCAMAAFNGPPILHRSVSSQPVPL